MYLDLEHNRCAGDVSPPSDNVIFDNQCYATTPSSSNGNSDPEQQGQQQGQPQHHPQQQQQQQQQAQQQQLQQPPTGLHPPNRRCNMQGTVCHQHPMTTQPAHVQYHQQTQYQQVHTQYQQQQQQQFNLQAHPQQQQSQQQQQLHPNSQQAMHQHSIQQRQLSVESSTPGSPTNRLLHEYEMHMRNPIMKTSIDSDGYNRHSFETDNMGLQRHIFVSQSLLVH